MGPLTILETDRIMIVERWMEVPNNKTSATEMPDGSEARDCTQFINPQCIAFLVEPLRTKGGFRKEVIKAVALPHKQDNKATSESFAEEDIRTGFLVPQFAPIIRSNTSVECPVCMESSNAQFQLSCGHVT